MEPVDSKPRENPHKQSLVTSSPVLSVNQLDFSIGSSSYNTGDT
jgi:hypothetical protein